MDSAIRKILHLGKTGGLKPSYQPILDVGAQKIIAFELLARLELPGQRLVLPGKFMPQVIKEPTAMLALDFEIWSSAIKFIKANRIMININLEEVTLEDAKFRNWLEHESQTHNLHFGIEITERVHFRKLHHHVDWLERMRLLGNKIIMDDFPLSRRFELCKLPATVVKLDRHVIQRLCNEDKNEVLEQHVNRLKNMNVEIWAEGVETPEQGQKLLQYGIEVWQGWHVGGHMTAEQVKQIWNDKIHKPTLCYHIDKTTAVDWETESIGMEVDATTRPQFNLLNRVKKVWRA